LLAACQNAESVNRVVVKSSTAVYGSSPRDPAMFTESMSAKSAAKSGYAKDCAECETKEGKIDHIERAITFEGDLSAEQRAKLLEIADKCPVHRTLKSEVDIRTKEEAAS